MNRNTHEPASAIKLRILLVDDDDGIRDSLAELLESEGYRVVVAENGAEALRRLATMRPAPDVILLDLMMPVMDGFEFRDDQRADVRFASIPVIVMSADPQLDQRSERLGARAYLKKPFDVNRLLEAVAG